MGPRAVAWKDLRALSVLSPFDSTDDLSRTLGLGRIPTDVRPRLRRLLAFLAARNGMASLINCIVHCGDPFPVELCPCRCRNCLYERLLYILRFQGKPEHFDCY